MGDGGEAMKSGLGEGSRARLRAGGGLPGTSPDTQVLATPGAIKWLGWGQHPGVRASGRHRPPLLAPAGPAVALPHLPVCSPRSG